MGLTAAEASDLFRKAPARFVPVDGGRGGEVACRSVGSGPDVLFVHGWPVSGATFRLLLPHLADHVTCHLIDLPGCGSSHYGADTMLSIDNHVAGVRAAVDALGLTSFVAVGHDSGGLIARKALAGDARLRAMGLIDTEQPHGPSLRFRSFLANRHVPGFGAALRALIGSRRLRRSQLVLGGAFVDRSLLDGEFDEFFLRPLRESPELLAATMRILKTFEYSLFRELPDLHRRITVPVHLVWGEQDPFFPVAWAREMVDTFPNAGLTVIANAALFAHEERPAEVAKALLPVLRG